MGGEQGQQAVRGQGLFGRGIEQHAAVQPGDAVGQAAHGFQVMFDPQHGDPGQAPVIEQAFEHLDAGFIGELYFQKGPWGLGWRSMFLGTKSDFKTEAVTGLPGPLPPIIGQHRIKVENELFTSDLVASYQFTDWFGAYTGVRRTGNKTRVEIRPLEPGLIEIEGRRTVIDEELFDWVVGIDLIHRFNQHWWASAQMDLGIDGEYRGNVTFGRFIFGRRCWVNPRQTTCL